MEQRYFSDMLAALANRASLGTVSWLGFANAPLRRHLMEVFSRPYGDTGNFLADPTFEAVFGWAPGPVKMGDLAGSRLMSQVSMNSSWRPNPMTRSCLTKLRKTPLLRRAVMLF